MSKPRFQWNYHHGFWFHVHTSPRLVYDGIARSVLFPASWHAARGIHYTMYPP